MVSSSIPMMSVLQCSSLKTTPKNKNNTTTSTSNTNNNRTSTGSTTSNNKKQQKQKQKQRQQQQQHNKPGKFGYFGEVVLKDVEYMKRNISRGFEWANRAFRVNEISKTLDDFIWFRNLEDTNAVSYRFPTWPIPQYAELTGVDLLAADLKALEAYMTYFFYLSKMWTKPLPEVYDPQEVADYFNCRPHVVALRLLEVFASFAAVVIKIRTSAIRTRYSSSVNKDDDQSISQYNYGMVLKETMLNLGPTFIKVGQSLATRPDIIGSEITKALSELHDQIPPFPRTLAMKIIEEELGSPVETFFSYLSPEPVAAASFGQVYRGRTIDGANVAVKVQRPNMRHVVVRDVYILRLGLGLFRRIAKRKSDLRLYADELGKGLVGELDYTLEAANALDFMDAHSQFTFISVPKVFRHLSGKKVLTMEWMVGESPSDLVYRSSKRSVDRDSNFSERQQSEARRQLLDLVNKGVQATLVQLLETGVLHGDPHPGNLRYTSSGYIGFLDFGLLCRMKKKHQFAMLASIVHIVNGDWASLVKSLDEMDVVSPGTSIRRVTMDLEDSLGEVEFKDGMPDVKFSRVLSKIWVVAYKFHFRMPPYFTVLLRSLASLEGLAVMGDPNFKTFESAYPYVVQKLLTDNSADMRRILHSVVFNRRKEFQWKKLALFLRIGATRKGIPLASDTYVGKSTEGPTSVFEVTNLVLRLVQSKDGVVLRRLLMTANGASLIRAMVSKEAVIFRQELCRMIADTLYKSICESLEGNLPASQYIPRIRLAGVTQNIQKSSSSRFTIPIFGYNSILKDRRLKVIFLNALKSARTEPTLILRFCWASAVIFLAASALACHRVVVSLSEVYLGPVSVSQRQFAVGS